VERLCAVALEFAPDAREDALSAHPEGEGHFEQQLLRCFPGEARTSSGAREEMRLCVEGTGGVGSGLLVISGNGGADRKLFVANVLVPK